MAEGPLAGRRVIELAGIGPGPFASMMLADLGAEVVRVDRPGGSFFAGKEHVDLLNRGKKSILLDLRRPEAVQTVRALVERADVLIEGYRPGVAERLGVSPEECLARNPRLVYGRMTGWGQDGPLANLAGHDISYIALTGALHAIGEAGGPPRIPLNLIGDFGGGGAYLVIGILAALDEARRSGRGQVVDAAIVDGTAHLLAGTHMMLAAGGWADQRGVNLLDGGAPFYSVYETADGRYMAVGALEPKFYVELLGKLGLDEDPARQNDRSRWPELRRRIADAFVRRTQEEWNEVFAQSDACVAPVLSLREAAEHPHIKARGSIVDRDGLLQPAPAPRFSRTPTALGASPPVPGQDTDEVLASWGVGGRQGSVGASGAEESDEPEEHREAVAELGAELRWLEELATRAEVPAEVLRGVARRVRDLAPILR
ncbi:CoA transferase [Saccharopolyspora terrae]|uniref:CoA transferase n=1 Tax=Saccharopolyspora terrae TaxID=2530384 RepID=A0A4V6PCH5_9PSEU|nr:CaiB/BaiF CoA-transferase family protein [Saccharopolyspora terrae]TDC99505.1 CoA transferase [Saccharopolyspora terrae]